MAVQSRQHSKVPTNGQIPEEQRVIQGTEINRVEMGEWMGERYLESAKGLGRG